VTIDRRFGYAFGAHDETLRRWPDVIEGITRNERQRAGRSWRKHGEIVRGYDLRVPHHITQVAASCAHPHNVADADVSERTEEAISMPSNRAVARLPRLRRIGEMSGSSPQRLFIIAVDDRSRYAKTGNIKEDRPACAAGGRFRLR
jgi:hypothetical protein